MGKIDFIEKELQSLKERDQYRQIRWIEEGPAPWVRMNGGKVLLLCSNNYLGLANDPRLKEKMLRGVEAWGCGSGGSRSISGRLAIHRLLEERLARFHGHEKALLFNSGYSANLSLLTALMGEGDVIYSDELNHASIGDEAPLPEMIQLAKRYDALTMVDEAHAIGVFGPTGRGTLEHFQLSQEVDILMGTFGKALGCFGAYMAGKKSLIEFLINTGRVFLYTTALPPSVCACVLASLDLLDEEPERRERLWRNAHYFRKGLNPQGFDTMKSQAHIIPVLIGEPKITMEMARRILKRRVWVIGLPR